MNFNNPRRQRSICANDQSNVLPHLKHNLQFYTDVPYDQISLFELVGLALERQKALQAVESAGQTYNKHSDEYKTYLDKELKRLCNQKLKIFHFGSANGDSNIENVFEMRKNDNLSHFILLLAYCENKELRDWFIAQETDLFKFRYNSETGASIQHFLDLNNLNIVKISDEEKQILAEELMSATASLTKFARLQNGAKVSEDAPLEKRLELLNTVEFFKTPFLDVLDLVKSRKILMRSGFAYVPKYELITIVAGKFRNKLSYAFAVLTKQQSALADERLMQIFKVIRNKGCSVSSYVNNDANHAKITPDMIDSLSKASFPPCMRNMYTHLHKEHHLRFDGRFQFGLFLKGIGLTLEDSLRFFKTEFAPKYDSEKFDKNYAYNIRHYYGQVGKRADYQPYSCMKIVTGSAPGPQDAHGCPFKHMDAVVLRQNLKNWSIKTNDEQNTIVKLAETKQYDRACSRFFEFTHQMNESTLPQLISHPNQYFEESRKRLANLKQQNSNDDDLIA